MTRKRKTVDLITLISRANGVMAAPGSTPEERMALHYFISSIAMEAEQYAGFAYIKPGGERVHHEDVQAGNYDETRRRMFVSQDLRDRS